ncbi:MAG: alkyl hydroperoxide reductase, partial [Elusimicrobia bacterium]|nr:alkyl hydroperoxide reductase [Elusimicrobiota bacterium]
MSVELESLLSQLPEHAADIKINLGRVLAEEGSPGLSRSEILAVALACAYACRCQSLADALEGQADGLAEAETRAAKAAAALMAMNNV